MDTQDKPTAVATPETPMPKGKRGFSPGVSGNSRGRPHLPADLKVTLATMAPEVLDRIYKFTSHKNPTIALKALKLLAEYCLPKQTIVVDSTVKTTIDPSKLDTSELQTLLAITAKAK